MHIKYFKKTLSQRAVAYKLFESIEGKDTLSGSELVYITSLNIELDIYNALGVILISPDNVAIVSTREDTVFTIPLI